MTRKQLKKQRKGCMKLLVMVAVVLVACVAIISTRTKEGDKTQDAAGIQIAEPENEMQEENKYKIFDCMSEDWGSEDVEGFVYYELPEEYADTGYFPKKMQIYTRCLCKQYGVSYALVLAMIEYESGYEFDAIGDGGKSKGYMQIYEKFHTDRMEKLGCNDLMNPYQNVYVGVDFIAELIEKYGTVQDALAAYNYGEKSARENLWNKGIYVYKYNETIMNRMKEIEEVVGE